MSDLHWALQREQPPEKSGEEDSDFSIISDESDDEEDNRLRQEYYCYRLNSFSKTV